MLDYVNVCFDYSLNGWCSLRSGKSVCMLLILYRIPKALYCASNSCFAGNQKLETWHELRPMKKVPISHAW